MSRRLNLVALVVSTACAAACGGSPAPTPPIVPGPTPEPTPGTEPGEPVFVVDGPVRFAAPVNAAPDGAAAAVPQATSAEQAPPLEPLAVVEERAARDALALVFGPEWEGLLASPRSEQVTLVRTPATEEQPRPSVQARLTAEQLRSLLTEPPPRDALLGSPAPVRDALEPWVEEAWQIRLCELRKRHELSGADAVCPGTDDLAAAVAAVAARLELKVISPSSVPRLKSAAGVRLARAPSFVASWAAEDGTIGVAALPVAGVHVAHAEHEELAGVTDAQGVVGFPSLEQSLPEALQEGPLVFGVDRGKLAGPLASYWPAMSLSVELRDLDPRRLAVRSVERRDGSSVASLVAARVVETLRPGFPASKTLSASVGAEVDAIVLAKPQTLSARHLAVLDPDVLGADFAALAVVESDYGSRLNAHRLWYQARADVRLFNLWTGALVATSDTSATQSGLGAERADQAARIALVEPVKAMIVEWIEALEAAPSPPVAAIAGWLGTGRLQQDGDERLHRD